MKPRIILTIMMAATAITTNGQNATAFDPKPYFSAVIVNNIDSSAIWYQSVFGLKVINRINDPERGVRVVILESTQLLAELIENQSWLEPRKILENKPEGTRIQGFFKIGFKVANMDAYINHLKKLKIPIERVYTDSSTNKRNFLINDPDGNLIQFFE